MIPDKIDLKKDSALTLHWPDGSVSVYPVLYLRRMSPSADARELRQEQATNRLAILPSSYAKSENLTATTAALVGNYALRIEFSDGHRTGIYSWSYLLEIDPARAAEATKQSGEPPQ